METIIQFKNSMLKIPLMATPGAVFHFIVQPAKILGMFFILATHTAKTWAAQDTPCVHCDGWGTVLTVIGNCLGRPS